MSTYKTTTENGIDARTRRACTESMTVVPAGPAEFDVYSGTRSRYSVNLVSGHCSCPDFEHNAPADGCKHVRRVELEAGVRDIPAPIATGRTDVELMISAREEPEPEPEPESITVSDSKPARRVATDGGVVVSEAETLDESSETAGPEPSPDATVTLHGVVAETTSTTEDLPDFDVYCAAVEVATQHIRRLVEHEVAP